MYQFIPYTIVIEWAKILPFIEENVLSDTKMAEHRTKYQICMQDKLHAGQYSHFPAPGVGRYGGRCGMMAAAMIGGYVV